MKKYISFLFLLTLLLGLALSISCRLYNLERKLDPANAEFLSKVRYIITSGERKNFLELPDSEKPRFIEEFWKRRDPDPDTEVNEFKIEYFNRLEKATEIFPGEGIPGWLTDRGRIYVLFGPPMDRITHPMGEDPYSRCSEVWYYGDFPVVFIDTTCTGNYKLVTYDLSPLQNIDLSELPALNLGQKGVKEGGKRLFDFSVRIEKSIQEAGKVQGLVILEIPYDRIWFKADGKTMETILEVGLELKDVQNKIIWEYKGSFELKLDEVELEEKSGKSYSIDIPFLFDKESELSLLSQGKCMLHTSVKNKTGNESLNKALEFR